MNITNKILTVCALTLLVVSAPIGVRAAQAASANADLAIWNPKSVDWWVAESSDVDNICQIHWVYDDEIDVYLKKNAEDLYYFGLEFIGEDAKLEKLFQNGVFEPILIVNEEQIKLNAERIGSNKVIAKASWAINSLEYLKDGEALFLKSEDALYSFPLENSIENYDVYYKCLKDNGQYVERNAPVEAVELPSVDQLSPVLEALDTDTAVAEVVKPDYSVDGFSLLFGDNPEQQEELARKALELQRQAGLRAADEEAAQEVLQLEDPQEMVQLEAQDEAPSQPVAAAPEVRAPSSNSVRKAKDFLGTDLNYIEDEQVSAVSGAGNVDETGIEKSCGEGVGGNITGVIQNLTRKLAILEREKETLRMKLIASGSDPVVSDLLACKSSGVEEQALLEASDSAIKEYKVLIESMRAEIDELRLENELLNASVVDAPAASAASIPEMAKLNDKINQLEIKNLQLNREVEEFKNIIDQEAEAQEEGALSESQPLTPDQQEKVNEVLENGFGVDVDGDMDWDNLEQEAEDLLGE